MNDDYEPVLEDPDLMAVDWRALAAGIVLGGGVGVGLLLLWLERR